MKVDIFDTDKKYDLILADPPWRQSKGGKKAARPNTSGMELDYPVCSLDEIKSHIKAASDLTGENSIMFL